jgi:hypothetical protein
MFGTHPLQYSKYVSSNSGSCFIYICTVKCKYKWWFKFSLLSFLLIFPNKSQARKGPTGNKIQDQGPHISPYDGL